MDFPAGQELHSLRTILPSSSILSEESFATSDFDISPSYLSNTVHEPQSCVQADVVSYVDSPRSPRDQLRVHTWPLLSTNRSDVPHRNIFIANTVMAYAKQDSKRFKNHGHPSLLPTPKETRRQTSSLSQELPVAHKLGSQNSFDGNSKEDRHLLVTHRSIYSVQPSMLGCWQRSDLDLEEGGAVVSPGSPIQEALQESKMK